MSLSVYFKEWLDATERDNPGPCECGARWYRTTGGRIRIDHDLDRHRALAHPVDRPVEPQTFVERRSFAERRLSLERSPLPYPND